MNARKKLNVGFIAGSILTAAAFGGMAGSWLVFAIMLVILIGFHLYQGDIRPDQKQHS